MGIMAYSASNDFNRYALKETEVKIKRVENGYIFELEGNRETPPVKGMFDRWERFSATFVYATLEEGLAEVDSFFKMIDEKLTKRIAARKKVVKKEVKPKTRYARSSKIRR